MKIITTEFAHSYRHFSFGYAQFALREPKDTLADIYDRGFLPDSSVPEHPNLFYRARSARIALSHWKPNSENRRILKRFDGTLTHTRTPFSRFNHKDKAFRSFCLTYFKKRHGKEAMPEHKFDTILHSKIITDVLTYNHNGDVMGYVLEVSDKKMGHFWFSFYDLSYAFKSLGMWLMIDAVREAKKAKKVHYYLGTVYGDKAVYKTNFDALEYWDGEKWSRDIKTLRTRSRSDAHRELDIPAEWKEPFFPH